MVPAMADRGFPGAPSLAERGVIETDVTRREQAIAGLTVGLGAAFAFGPMVFSTFSLFMLPLSTEFGWSRAQAALALTICACCAAVANPLAGRLSDRVGPRKVLLVGLLAFAICNAALSLATNLVELYVIHAFLGASAAACGFVPYFKILVGWFRSRRGMMIGLAIGLGTGAGSVVMAQLARVLIDTYGWQATRLIMGGLILLIPFPMVWLFLREAQPEAAGRLDSAAAIEGVSAAKARTQPTFWKILGISAIGTTCLAGAVVHLVALLVDRKIDLATATTIFSICAAAKAVGQILVGFLQDRVPSARIGLLVYGSGLMAFLIVVFGQDVPALTLGAAFLGLAFGGEMSLAPYWASRYWGMKAYGEIYGLLYCASVIGSAVGPLIMAAVFDGAGDYRPAMAAFAVGMGICLLLNLTLSRFTYPVEARA
jgi:MFS family permease